MSAPLAPVQGLVAYLAALAGPEAERHGYLELRHRPRDAGGGMRQRFFDATTPNAAGIAARVLSSSGDVFVGCAPRARRAGGKDAVERGWVLWADCDSEESIDRLAAFEPQPPMLVRSGHGLHAYWPIDLAQKPHALEKANRRLAHKLGADPACADAARILRPPLTRNYKYDPPALVQLVRLTGERLSPRAVVGQLPDPPNVRGTATRGPRRDDGETLLQLAPAVYVERLLGVQVPRDGKVSCPFHEDRTPSLHVFDEPAQGWYCFGCRRGGSIFDLAAPLYGYATRGCEFRQLKLELLERFALEEA